MTENPTPDPGTPPRLPPSSPRSAETPPSPGAFTIAFIGCAGLAYFVKQILDANIFPPESTTAKALVIVAAIASAGALTCAFVAKKLNNERDSQEFSYRLERDEIRARNPKAFADDDDEEDE